MAHLHRAPELDIFCDSGYAYTSVSGTVEDCTEPEKHDGFSGLDANNNLINRVNYEVELWLRS